MPSFASRVASRMASYVLLAAVGQGYAQTFPAGGWAPLTRQGTPVADVAGDESLANTPGIDVVGDKADPGGYIASDADYLYFRLRLAQTPWKSGGRPGYLPYVWTCLLDTGTPAQTYALLSALDGATGNVELWQNTATAKADDIKDPAETMLATYSVSTNAEYLNAGSALGGSSDYFVDWAAPWADMNPALAKSQPFRLACGSSTTSGALIAGDILDDANDVSTPATSLVATESDAMLCGDGGCQYDAVFADGFEGR